MGKLIAVACLWLVLVTSSMAQRSSPTPEAFLKDLDSVAAMPRAGAALYAEDPTKKTWQNYCGDSQRLADRGDFRLAVRAAAKALYVGDPNGTGVGGAYIFATRDIANAYSLAGDHATAAEWAARMLSAIDKGASEEWLLRQLSVLRATGLHVRALALSSDGKHAEAVAEIKKAQDLLPFFGQGFFKSELRLALAAIELRAGRLAAAADAVAPVLSESDPVLRLGAARLAGDIALAGNEAKKAIEIYGKALPASTDGKVSFQGVMLRAGLARAQRQAGNPDAAANDLRQALQGLESLRSGFSSFEMRTALYGSHQQVFDEAVDQFFERGDAAAALAASEASRARAMLDLLRRVPSAGPTVDAASVRPSSLPEIQAQLSRDQVLIVYHELPHRLLSWRITRDNIKAHAHAIPAERLRAEVARFRAAIEGVGPDAHASAKVLHNALIEPLQIPEGPDLIVVPHKSLHLLPFQALLDGKQWLIERNSVSTVLSASLLKASAPAAAPEVFAALGNPDLGNVEWDLPGAEREVNDVRALYARATVFTRKEATKARLAMIAPGAEVVHVAAHAVVDDIDPMYSTIKLASSGQAGQHMEARELAGLGLGSARLITLSACNSGVGKVAHGDEFMGFKRAVLAAGAQSALLSLWAVEDESTRILMTEFHRAWKTQSKSRAMQAAQLKVLADPRYRDPYFWAAFTLIGSH